MNQGPDTASAEAAKEKLGEQAEAAASAKSGEPAAPDASAAANRETGLALPDEDAPSNAEVLAALRQSEALQMQWFQAIHQQVNSVFPWLQSIGGQVGGVQQSVSLLQSEIKARPALPPQPVAAPLAPPVPVPAKPAPSESASGFSLEGIAANIGQAIQNVTGSSDSGPRAAAKASDDGAWEAVFFGRDLSTAPQLAAQRQELLRDLRSGQPEAQALVGLLLLFRGSAAEKMPVLLKDMGEAWYRWRPGSAHGEDPLRQALIRWLEGQCDSAGSNNRIELVRPGDRFDSKKHNARDPGVEVAEVYGWVVLRDNGKIYTKANVVAQ